MKVIIKLVRSYCLIPRISRHNRSTIWGVVKPIIKDLFLIKDRLLDPLIGSYS
jgi:hypothetical protein